MVIKEGIISKKHKKAKLYMYNLALIYIRGAKKLSEKLCKPFFTLC